MNRNNHLIIRNETALAGQIGKTKTNVLPKWDNVDIGGAGDATATLSNQTKFRKVFTRNNGCSLPQIAIKRKNNDSPSSMNTEVVS